MSCLFPLASSFVCLHYGTGTILLNSGSQAFFPCPSLNIKSEALTLESCRGAVGGVGLAVGVAVVLAASSPVGWVVGGVVAALFASKLPRTLIIDFKSMRLPWCVHTTSQNQNLEFSQYKLRLIITITYSPSRNISRLSSTGRP